MKNMRFFLSHLVITQSTGFPTALLSSVLALIALLFSHSPYDLWHFSSSLSLSFSLLGEINVLPFDQIQKKDVVPQYSNGMA